MMTTATDPRVARSRAAVLRAATDLLVEGGPTAVTVDAIVTRSGVAKSTIYRHWPTRDAILLTVLETSIPRLTPPPPEADYATAIRAVTDQLITLFNDPDWTRVMPALMTLRAHVDDVAVIDERMHDEQDAVARGVLQRGIDEGVLRADLDPTEAAATWVGPLLFAQVAGTLPLDDALAEHVVAVVERVYGAPR